MVMTDDDELAERCRSLRNLCFGQKRFIHEEIGWNYRMTNLQAALGLAQMERLSENLTRKREMGRRYSQLLAGVPGLQLPVSHTDYAENIYWVYGMVLHDDVPFDAEELMKRLHSRGVGTRPFFWNMHEQPVFQKMGLFEGEHYPAAEKISRRGFYVPSGLGLSDEQINRVAGELAQIMKAVS